MERIIKKINLTYYLIYTVTILATIIGYILTMNKANTVDFKSTFSITLSSVVILYIIVSIPAALAIFHRNTQKWCKIEDRYTKPVSYTHLRAHETDSYLVCRLLLEK